MSTLFQAVFAVTVPFWLLMIVVPTWRWTARIVASPWIVAPPLVIWVVLAIPRFGELWPAVSQPSLAGWAALLTDPGAATAAWAQIIAWDLFVGRWIYHDSRERDIHPLVMVPILVLTILLSPLALPLYLALRGPLGRAGRSE